MIKYLCIPLIQIFFIFSVTALSAQEQRTEKRSACFQRLREACKVDFRALLSGEIREVADTSQNPDNSFLELPSSTGLFEFRPDLSVNTKGHDLLVKPRLALSYDMWKDGTLSGEDDGDAEMFVNEWLLRLRLYEGCFLSYGRENLQWGPAYLFSPSNPFFQDNGRSNPKKEIPGMDFARFIWLPIKDWTVSFIVNTDEGRQDFQGLSFEKTCAVKIDYFGTEKSFGTIFSATEERDARFGGYLTWTTSDAMLVYTEGSLIRGARTYRPGPANNPFGLMMIEEDKDNSDLSAVILIGAQYTLELGPTITFEYLYNGLGYNNEEADDYYSVRDAAGDTLITGSAIIGLARQILRRAANPGMRFLRRNYLMLQYNHNDINDKLSLTFRWSQNLDDASCQFLSILEYYLGDHVQLFGIGVLNVGEDHQEFGSSSYKSQLMIGCEYIF